MAVVVAVAGGCGPTAPPPPTAPRTGTPGPAERFPEVPGPEACSDVVEVTLDELGEGKGHGEVVAVEAVPIAFVICTSMYCSPESPEICCNECKGSYVLRKERSHRVFLSGLGHCGDMDCNLDCQPFGRKPTTAYRFVGKHTFEPGGKYTSYASSIIAVDRFCSTASSGP